MPSVRVLVRIAAMASRSVADATSIRPPSASAASCGPMPGIVEPGRGRVRFDDLAVRILEHQRARAVEDARRPAQDRGGMPAGLDPVAGGLDDREPDASVRR